MRKPRSGNVICPKAGLQLAWDFSPSQVYLTLQAGSVVSRRLSFGGFGSASVNSEHAAQNNSENILRARMRTMNLH